MRMAELSSEALGGKILSFSDEFFSPAVDLLKVPAAISKKGQFGPNGALFDGWETRRHNPDHDWWVSSVTSAGLQAYRSVG